MPEPENTEPYEITVVLKSGYEFTVMVTKVELEDDKPKITLAAQMPRPVFILNDEIAAVLPGGHAPAAPGIFPYGEDLLRGIQQRKMKDDPRA